LAFRLSLVRAALRQTRDRRKRAPMGDVNTGPSVLQEVSNRMVHLYKEQFGRGPTRAHSHWAGPDTLLCTLEDSMTPAERNLVQMGEQQRLRDTRMFFQYASEHEFVSAVEQIVGRKVRAFVSGIDSTRDVSAELFYFERA
jgi:uncharacterized protein YbcI